MATGMEESIKVSCICPIFLPRIVLYSYIFGLILSVGLILA